MINKEETDINRELFQKHFRFKMATTILKAAYTTNNRRKTEELVNVMKSGLSDLKNKIEEMSTDESEIEKPYKIVNIAEKILDFNRQN